MSTNSHIQSANWGNLTLSSLLELFRAYEIREGHQLEIEIRTDGAGLLYSWRDTDGCSEERFAEFADLAGLIAILTGTRRQER